MLYALQCAWFLRFIDVNNVSAASPGGRQQPVSSLPACEQGIARWPARQRRAGSE
jgi:hypothetical protein